MGFLSTKIIIGLVAALIVVVSVVVTVVVKDDNSHNDFKLVPVQNTDASPKSHGNSFEQVPVQNTGRDKGY